MCPTGQHRIRRTQGYMTAELYQTILGQLWEYKTPIRFVRFGEPTLHTELTAFIREAKSRDIPVHINTNGFYVSDKMMTDFVNIPLDSIKFSFQGTERKEYERWRKKDFFEDLITTVRTLDSMRKYYKKDTPFIVVGTTITDETPEQIEVFKMKVEKYCDLFLCGKTEALTEPRFTLKECPEVFDKLSINFDGTVSACCGDYDNKMLIGDLKEDTLLDIWFGPRLAVYREMIVNKLHSQLDLCRSCIR